MSLLNKLKNKKGNSYLFMPYMCIFGCMFIYIFMDMGSAYARSIEMQSIADAGCRAGVFGGMNGQYTQYIVERYNNQLSLGGGGYNYVNPGDNGTDYHVYVMLDGGTALAVSREIVLENLRELSIETGGSVLDITPGKLYVSSGEIKLSDPRVFDAGDIHGVSTIPVWNKVVKEYQPVNIASFRDYYEVMKSGNFFVSIKGEYRTIIASTVLGRESISMSAFAAAVATAELKPDA